MKRVALPVLSVLLVLLASACGASDPIASEEVSAAVAKTASAGSSRMEIASLEDGKRMVMRGVADHERRRAALTYETTASGSKQLSGTEFRVIGTTMYMETSAFGLSADPAKGAKPKPWFKVEGFDDEVTIDALLFPFPFIQPGKILAAFEQVSGAVETLGAETVRGVPTERYRLTLDLARLIETAPAGDRAALRKELEQRKTKSEPVEIWIDDAGLARRVRFVVDSDGVTIDFFDFGIDVKVEAPPADQVEDFDALLGAARDDTEVGSGEIFKEPAKEDE